MAAARATRRKRTQKRSARIILVVGGAASGKSDAALQLAGTSAPRACVATAQARDEEMAARIHRHRQRRASDWKTSEVPIELTAWYAGEGQRYQTIVLDCVTLWLSNLIESQASEADIDKRVTQLLDSMRRTKAKSVIVSNELGMGLVPADLPARRFRDIAGRINRQIAAEADEVYVVLSGIPVRIK